MQKLKTKWFHEWAKRNSIPDTDLHETIADLINNLSMVNLGSGLYKVRTRKPGSGKSGGYRTLIVYRKKELAIFVFGFSKTDKDNLDKDELDSFKKFSKELLKLDREEYSRQIELSNFIRLEEKQ